MIKRLRLYILLLSLMVSGVTFAQPKANIGIFAGTAYYMGDINPNRHFYRSSLSLGGLYRYNLNTRIALRFNAYYARLSGSDLDFPKILHPDRPFRPAMFNTSLLDAALQIEFNFLPFTPNLGNWAYTPYISAGIAGALITSSRNFASIPFGIGAKVNLTSRISAGAEWSFRKTFTDRIDGIRNPSETGSLLHNNDWYSFLGVFITFKFFNFAADCPAYN
jgi:hypothetical protein